MIPGHPIIGLMIVNGKKVYSCYGCGRQMLEDLEDEKEYVRVSRSGDKYVVYCYSCFSDLVEESVEDKPITRVS